MSFSQVPHTILLIRPAAFGFNPETAATNAFQKELLDKKKMHQKALLEFDRVVESLNNKGISTLVVEDTATPITTDAIFPNNWITTHEDGKIILYPMMAPSRRNERRSDIVLQLQSKYGTKELIDLSSNELDGKFLEGTGSIIFDHPNQIAFACRSERTDETLFKSLCNRLGYMPIMFNAVDDKGLPIYHTNVMMWIGEKLAGVCLDSVHDEADQEEILNQLARTNHKVIALSYHQMNSFAGNMFEVQGSNHERYLLMSQTALDSLMPGQLAEMEKYVIPFPLEISTIEQGGGGSIRCMVAGIHLPSK